MMPKPHLKLSKHRYYDCSKQIFSTFKYYGKMASHEFDGSFLQSLSIDDSNYVTSQTRYEETYDNDDDYMEIDNTLDLGPPPSNYDTPPPEHGNVDRLTPTTRLQEYIASPFQSTPISKDEGANLGGMKSFFMKKEDEDNSSVVNDREMTETKNSGSDNDNNDSEVQERENGQEIDQDYSRNASVVSSISHSILSPTTLGAKLAIMPRQKLLLPSNMDNHESIDYEIDTNSNNESYSTNYDTFGNYRSTPELKHRTGQRNMSSFSSSDANAFFANKSNRNNDIEEYTYNPINGDYDSNDSRSTINNSMNQSYMYRKNMNKFPVNNIFSPTSNSWTTPLQVHHHHYYTTPINQSATQLANPSQTEILSQIQLQTGQLQHRDPGLIQVLDPNQSYNFHSQNRDISLPLPWEANSSPLEKASYILSSYLQLIINFVATCYAAYLVYSIIQTVRQDIKHKLSQQISNVLVEIESCKRSYNDNNCSPDLIVPILEKPCAYWLKCMNQDPYNGGGNKSLISAETVGMIINSLIEPLSFKFFLVMFGFVLLIFACNFTFGFIRAKSYYGWNKERNGAQPAIEK